MESARLLPYTGSCNFTSDSPEPPLVVMAHINEANALIREQRFLPWVIKGRPVRTLLQWELPIAPPERIGPHRSIPNPIDGDSFSIRLERHGCEGRCPAYSITIAGDGTVTYDGHAFVKVLGTQQTHISRAAAVQLFERFLEADFASALPSYIGAYDGGDSVLKLKVNGKSLQVVDASGLRVGMPTAILNLEQAVDDAAQSRRWIDGE
ncbi:MAG TPA: DUF6438 domain-containing protein [Terracidiphilus sp.]|nr:DUF6438 domain-containing protein [Terracidiphilus sp.]